MTSSIIPYIYDLYVACDKSGCKEEAAIRINALTYRERRHAEYEAEAALEAQGWTRWSGTHPARRDYCPAHKPDKRSTMHRVQRSANVS
jgi:hypothetical protein